MQAITPEQKEQWRLEAPVLDYSDFHALDNPELVKFQNRIRPNRGAPRWAITARTSCIHGGWRIGKEGWLPWKQNAHPRTGCFRKAVSCVRNDETGKATGE